MLELKALNDFIDGVKEEYKNNPDCILCRMRTIYVYQLMYLVSDSIHYEQAYFCTVGDITYHLKYDEDLEKVDIYSVRNGSIINSNVQFNEIPFSGWQILC
jgi:hypothetical protein